MKATENFCEKNFVYSLERQGDKLGGQVRLLQHSR